MRTLLILLAAALTAAEPVQITVTDTVLRPAAEIEPLGVNNFGDIGGTKHANGNLITQNGFEPIRLRNLYRVLLAGSEGDRRWAVLDGSGTSNWQLYTSGTYSGGSLRAYRFTDAAGQSVGYKEVKGEKYLAIEQATACTPLFTTTVLPRGTSGLPEGGWQAPAPKTFDEFRKLDDAGKEQFKKDWKVWYSGGQELQLDDVVMVERAFAWPDPADFHPRTSVSDTNTSWEQRAGSLRFIPVPPGPPPEMQAGAGVGELTPAGGEAVFWYKLAGGTAREDAFWYGTLDADVTYCYEAWVRSNGPGTITLTFGENDKNKTLDGYFGQKLGQDFAVTSQWQRVGFTFTAPAPGLQGIWGATIRWQGQEPLLIDNLKLQPVYVPGDEAKPFVIHKPLFDTLMASQPPQGRKGAVRIWAGLSQASMASLCDWVPENEVGLGVAISVKQGAHGVLTLPRALNILEATGTSPETRMVPWIITQVTHSEDEYRQLVEYLAAPYDPATDTPQSKPMAWKRVQQRGHNRAWSADFREVILDFGNENWHNRKMAAWIGVGRSNAVHQYGRDFGLWARHMVQELRKSPYYADARIRINLGGNYSAEVAADGTVKGYGLEASVAAQGTADYHSHATYIGPRWEMAETSETKIDDVGVQRTLLAHRGGTEREWERQRQGDERLRAMGLSIRMTAYEGGPSGFGLRAKNKEEDAASEYYGKSLAMGTAMLDAWVNAWEKGWTWQCYLSFAQGRWWSSHTGMSQGHRASPGWLAMGILNRTCANRDLLAVTVQGGAALQVPEKGAKAKKGEAPPMRAVGTIVAHATRDARSLTVAVCNLHLTQEQTVVLQLPLASATRITSHTLRGDPRDTNLQAAKVEATSEDLPADRLQTGRFTATIPAGRPMVFVFSR